MRFKSRWGIGLLIGSVGAFAGGKGNAKNLENPVVAAGHVDDPSCEIRLQQPVGPRIVSTHSAIVQKRELPQEVQNAISRQGPRQQPMGVLITQKKEPKVVGKKPNGDSKLGEVPVFHPGTGEPVLIYAAYGTQSALSRVRENVHVMKDLLLEVTDTELDDTRPILVDNQLAQVRFAPALTGSARETDSFADLDAELLINIQYDDFKRDDFFDPKSLYARALEETLITYINNVEKKGFTFSDLKAGEYDHVPQNDTSLTHSRAIKWSRAEITARKKLIETKSGDKKWLTLAEALVSESRVKVDWLKRVTNPPSIIERTGGLTERFMEASVLLNLGGQRGNNSPVLRTNLHTIFPEKNASGGYTSISDYAQHSPVRITTIYFDPRHVQLARELAVSAPTPDLNYLNVNIINACRNYWSRGYYHKALRMLTTRLNYWYDLDQFAYHLRNGNRDEMKAEDLQEIKQLYKEINELSHDEVLMDLNLFYEIGKSLAEADKHGVADEFIKRDYVTRVRKFFKKLYRGQKKNQSDVYRGEHNAALDTVESMRDRAKNELNQRIMLASDKHPLINKYVAYVQDAEYSKEYRPLDTKRQFISFTVPNEIRQSYEQNLAEWQKKYKQINFANPVDLHMTISYVGRIREGDQTKLDDIVKRMNAVLITHPFALEKGSFKIIGTTNNQLAVVFDVEAMPPEVKERILHLRGQISELGVQPDHHFTEFMPHISIAHLANRHGNPRAHSEINAFLSSESPTGMDAIFLSSAIDLRSVKETSFNSDNSESRYEIRRDMIDVHDDDIKSED